MVGIYGLHGRLQQRPGGLRDHVGAGAPAGARRVRRVPDVELVLQGAQSGTISWTPVDGLSDPSAAVTQCAASW